MQVPDERGTAKAAAPSAIVRSQSRIVILHDVFGGDFLFRFEPFTLIVAGFSLISRCTHRAHAAFQLIEKLKLSLQSIMGATEKR